MYKDYSVDQWRSYFSLPSDYTIDGVVMFGSNENYAYDLMRTVAMQRSDEVAWRYLRAEYFSKILEVSCNEKRIWFFVAYGGAQLSEYLHLACMLGSRANILFGNCGGLMKDAKPYDLIAPTYSYGTESSAWTYEPDAEYKYFANEKLTDSLMKMLGEEHTIHHGKTMTCQAMFGEGEDLVRKWIDEGYYAVEMEASTVFAVSNHFNVPSAAVLKVIDNLACGETIMENGYDYDEQNHQAIVMKMFHTALDKLSVKA